MTKWRIHTHLRSCVFAAIAAVLAVSTPCRAADTLPLAKDGRSRFVVLIGGRDGKTYLYSEYIIPFNGTFGEKELLDEEESRESDKMAKLILRRREKNNEATETAIMEKISAALGAHSPADLQAVVSSADKFSDEYEPPTEYYDVRSADGGKALTVFSPQSVRVNHQVTYAAMQAAGKPVLIDLSTLGVIQLPVAKISGRANFRFRWSPDGRYLAYKMSRDTVGIYDLGRKEPALTVHCDGTVDDMVWSRDSRSVAAAVLQSASSFRKVTDIVRTMRYKESESKHVCIAIIDVSNGMKQEFVVKEYVRHANVLLEWVK